VNSKFYTNAGSGVFVAGSVLDGKSRARKVNKMYVGVANKPTVTLPSGYTEVEYIESSGTQYIDTDFKPKYNSRVVMDVSDVSSDGWSALFGARDTASASATNMFVFANTTDITFVTDYFGTRQTFTVSD
jgi:hypothetical protein